MNELVNIWICNQKNNHNIKFYAWLGFWVFENKKSVMFSHTMWKNIYIIQGFGCFPTDPDFLDIEQSFQWNLLFNAKL